MESLILCEAGRSVAAASLRTARKRKKMANTKAGMCERTAQFVTTFNC